MDNFVTIVKQLQREVKELQKQNVTKIVIDGDTLQIKNNKTPASASATGNKGEVCIDSSYIYVCTATNTWKRAAISTW